MCSGSGLGVWDVQGLQAQGLRLAEFENKGLLFRVQGLERGAHDSGSTAWFRVAALKVSYPSNLTHINTPCTLVAQLLCGRENLGPILVSLNIRCRYIRYTQKGGHNVENNPYGFRVSYHSGVRNKDRCQWRFLVQTRDS